MRIFHLLCHLVERLGLYGKIYYFQCQRAITKKIYNQELRLICSALCHEGTLNGFKVIEQT